MWTKNVFLSVLVVVFIASNLLSSEFFRAPSPGTATSGEHRKNRFSLNTTRVLLPRASTSKNVVNVEDYMTGQADANKAFKEAWDSVCKSPRGVFIVPKHKIYTLKPINFTGPCEPDLTIRILGKIIASVNRSAYELQPRQWIVFEKLDYFTVEGGGVIDGSGKVWWEKSCKVDKTQPCRGAPTALTFYSCKNFVLSNLKLKDSQQFHVSFDTCENLHADDLTVTAPSNSPNTDGLHFIGSRNIIISNSVIRTGDDCISIITGSMNVKATNIICGPGHGISIGSLGKNNSEDHVSDVFIRKAKLSGTANGVRIKTWQGGSGTAKNFVFEDIEMNNVTNPIIIDQYYCDSQEPCPEQKSAVQVSNVVYRNVKGTSATELTTNFNCSKTYPCEGIFLENIHLRSQSGGTANASCANVKLGKRGKVSPSCSYQSSLSVSVK